MVLGEDVETWEIGAGMVNGKSEEQILRALQRDPVAYRIRNREPGERNKRAVFRVTIERVGGSNVEI